VLGSDGLWDVISNQNALDIARRHPTAECAARALVTEAYVRGSQVRFGRLLPSRL
jgi:protein phosphatase 1L